MGLDWSPTAVPKMNGNADKTVRKLPTELPGAITAQQLPALYQYTDDDFSDVWEPTIYSIKDGQSCLLDGTCVTETNTNYTEFEYCSWVDSTKTNMATRTWLIESFEDVEITGNAGIDKGAATPNEADLSFEPTPTITMPTNYKIQSPLTNFMTLSNRVFKVKKPTGACTTGIWKLAYDAQDKKVKWICDDGSGSSSSGGSGGSESSGKSDKLTEEEINKFVSAIHLDVVDENGNSVNAHTKNYKYPCGRLYLDIYFTLSDPKDPTRMWGKNIIDGRVMVVCEDDAAMCFGGEDCVPTSGGTAISISLPQENTLSSPSVSHNYIPFNYCSNNCLGGVIYFDVRFTDSRKAQIALTVDCEEGSSSSSTIPEDGLELESVMYADYYTGEDLSLKEFCGGTGFPDKVTVYVTYRNNTLETVYPTNARTLKLTTELFTFLGGSTELTANVKPSVAVAPGASTVVPVAVSLGPIPSTGEPKFLGDITIYDSYGAVAKSINCDISFDFDCGSSSKSSSTKDYLEVNKVDLLDINGNVITNFDYCRGEGFPTKFYVRVTMKNTDLLHNRAPKYPWFLTIASADIELAGAGYHDLYIGTIGAGSVASTSVGEIWCTGVMPTTGKPKITVNINNTDYTGAFERVFEFNFTCESSSSSSTSPAPPGPGGCGICTEDCMPIVVDGGTYVDIDTDCMVGSDAGKVKLSINDGAIGGALSAVRNLIPNSVVLNGDVTGSATSLTEGAFVIQTTLAAGAGVNSVTLTGDVTGNGSASNGSITIQTTIANPVTINQVVINGGDFISGTGEFRSGVLTINLNIVNAEECQ